MNDPFADRPTGETVASRAAIEKLAASGVPTTVDGAMLEGLDLSSLDLAGWTFERCDLRRTKFTGARLEATHWQTCRGAFADFSGADLTDAVLMASDFNNASFRRSMLGSARFQGCKLTGADLSEARALETRFEEILFVSAKLPSASFRNMVLQRIDFGQADLRKADFRGTVFEACSLRDANLAGSRFAGADLRGADLGGLRLIDAGLFRGATISREQAGQLLGELGLNVR